MTLGIRFLALTLSRAFLTLAWLSLTLAQGCGLKVIVFVSELVLRPKIIVVFSLILILHYWS